MARTAPGGAILASHDRPTSIAAQRAARSSEALARDADRVHLQNGLPADTAATPTTFGLRIVLDSELAANQLSDIVDRAAFHQAQRHAVNNDASAVLLPHTASEKGNLQIVRVVITRELQLVNVAVTAARLHRDPEAQLRIIVFSAHITQFLP